MVHPARIFLSHSHEDNLWCREFAQALRQAGADIWYDEHNLGYGSLLDMIETEMLARPIFLVALSPAAVTSRWVRSEVDAAIDLQYEQPERIILPVVVEKCDLPLFWRKYKRVCGPGDTGLSASEAARYVTRTLGLASGATTAAETAHSHLLNRSNQDSAMHTDLYGSVHGPGDFAAAIGEAPEAYRGTLRRLYDWAVTLERDRLARLFTFHGKRGLLTLLPYVLSDNAGLVTIYNDRGAYLQFWRSVFVSRAPESLSHIEQIIAPTPVGRGNWTASISDELLEALTASYREAARRYIRSKP